MKLSTSKLSLGAATLVVWAATTIAAQSQQAKFTWAHDSNSLALIGPGGVVWQYHFADELAKPFFDPVRLAGGEQLTWNEPPDHAWHHGLWFSWHTINGVNYWEHEPETGRPAGRTTWTPPIVHTTPVGAARIEMHLAYSPGDAAVVLKENRTIEVTAPGQSRGYYMDWDATFTPTAGDVVLDRTPIPPDPNGKPWGGYAGLSVRFAEKFADRRVVIDNREVEFDTAGIHRSPGIACDYQGIIDGNTLGVAIISHPSNPRDPTPFYVIRSNMSYLNPAFLQAQPYTVGSQESLRLRYRLIVHAGAWDQERLASEAHEYRSGE